MKHPGSSTPSGSSDEKDVGPACLGADNKFSSLETRSNRVALLLILLTFGGALLAIALPGIPVSVPPSSYVYPVMAPRLSSKYGVRIHPIRRFSHQHSGIDLAAPRNSPIRAIAAGRVVFADPYAGYGNLVVVQHNGTLTSHYGHCSTIKVRTGQVVKAGEIIAGVGSSGVSTGPHLHFEIRNEGTPINPERLIPGLASDAEG